ncbi:glycerophosphodiester phosphodiesterase [Shewanella sp.]|uniref:glycerophosphodiester phosphodiesterase n=1 Tax=Shewanella sp. TaxID=50422 RepID=UPI003562FA6C
MLIFAHRGASGYAPENTLKAMEMALSLGAEAIELDVHCVEGELMVFHDRHLAGKSNGKGLIHRQTLANLEKVKVQGEPIPTLWQVLELVRGRCIVNIELKGIGTAEPLALLYPRILTELGFNAGQLIISSFHHPMLAAFKAQVPEARVAPLLGSLPLDGAEIASLLNAYSLHLDVSFIDQAIVDDAHRRGVKVYVYTVDDSDDLQALREMGVDGAFSNFPDRAIEAISKPSGRDYRHWFE